MEKTKTTTGVVRLVRNGVVMAERTYNYSSKNLTKEYIVDKWRKTYGKKFFECEVHIYNVPVKEKILVPMEMRERTRRKIPGYFIASLPNFEITELLKVQKIVKEELAKRYVTQKTA